MMDRQIQRTPTDAHDQDEHADLLATLAAARELGPDMDKALAESYFQRRKATTPARPRVAEPRPPVNYGFVGRSVLPFLAIPLFIALLLLSSGHFWFLWFFLPMFWGGWWWRRGWGHWGAYNRAGPGHSYREERRAARDEWRRGRRVGRYDDYDWS